jgi:uncharacterized protein YegL
MSITNVSEQVPFGTDDFANNPEPRCALVLLLDTSGSMGGNPIKELNAGIAALKEVLVEDALASKRVEVGIITFGPVKVETTFHTASNFFPPMLQASGDTPMGEAIRQAIEMVKQRKAEYKSAGIPYFRPWIFLVTDGAPTDEWKNAAAMVREGEASKSFAFFAVGVENADMNTLKQIAVREPLKLKGLMFRELFVWLSSSMRSISSSVPGDTVPIASPLGWTEV